MEDGPVGGRKTSQMGKQGESTDRGDKVLKRKGQLCSSNQQTALASADS